ncbi:MAG: hypothetical protein JXA53_10470 [Bacteroidales bacterium]|nr:hypothetical protein [Bacteroidales bacterium]
MILKREDHHYSNITKPKLDQILNKFKENGASVDGNNPWNVNLHNQGIKIKISWYESHSSITISITGKDFYVTASRIWECIDTLVNHITNLIEAEAN